MSEHPLVTIWLRTKEGMEEKLDHTTKKQIFLLIALYGITAALDNAAIRNLGERNPFERILIYSIVLGPFMGALYWFLLSDLTHWTSRLLGGSGTWKETRTAVAWATIPYSTKLVLWVPQLLLFGREMFTAKTPVIDSNLILLTLFFLFGLLETIMNIGFIVVLSKSLGAAHQFSAWRGLGALVLPVVAVILFIVLLNISS
jgi:hypothetical protein